MTPSARRDESATAFAGMTGGQVDAVSVLTDALKAAGAKDVLDVGCGDGGVARALSRRGFTVTGIDPSAAAVARAGASGRAAAEAAGGAGAGATPAPAAEAR